MEAFVRSCADADTYPRNLLNADPYQVNGHSLENQLERRAERLFCKESLSEVDFLEQHVRGQSFSHRRIHQLAALESHLQAFDPDPHCRYM